MFCGLGFKYQITCHSNISSQISTTFCLRCLVRVGPNPVDVSSNHSLKSINMLHNVFPYKSETFRDRDCNLKSEKKIITMPHKLRKWQFHELAEEGDSTIIDKMKDERNRKLIYICKICHKAYKTLNQIKAHLKTKKHFNKNLNYHYNNSTLNHKSEIIPQSILPKLEIEGNEFVEIIEQKQGKIHSDVEGMELMQKGNTLSASFNFNVDIANQPVPPFGDRKAVGLKQFNLDHFECIFCKHYANSMGAFLKHMKSVHHFRIRC